jgi:hypothetical protein
MWPGIRVSSGRWAGSGHQRGPGMVSRRGAWKRSKEHEDPGIQRRLIRPAVWDADALRRMGLRGPARYRAHRRDANRAATRPEQATRHQTVMSCAAPGTLMPTHRRGEQ